MATPERGETGLRRRWRLLPLVLIGLGALHSAAIGVAEEPVIEPAEYAGGFSWRPSSATVAPGGTVAFRNPGKVVPHGLAWTQGPGTPSCSGVPVDSSGTDWSGTCAFTQAGTYTFVCTVHPEEMKGTITVGSGDATPAQPPPYGQPPKQSEGRAFKALRLARNQNGGAVRGSIVVATTAIGGKLTIELWARRAAFGGEGKGMVRVGQLTRAQLKAGRQPFEVTPNPSAQRTLRRRGRLSLTVKTAVKPPNGSKATATRRVELRG